MGIEYILLHNTRLAQQYIKIKRSRHSQYDHQCRYSCTLCKTTCTVQLHCDIAKKRSKRAKRRTELVVPLTYNILRKRVDRFIKFHNEQYVTYNAAITRCSLFCNDVLEYVLSLSYIITLTVTRALQWRLEYMKSARVQPHLPAFAIAHSCILGLHQCRFHALKPRMHCTGYSARY